MKYGLTRNLNVYSIDGKKGGTMLATAGDYIQSQLWCDKNLKGVSDGIKDLYQTFAWAYCAISRNGELDEYGLPEELTRDALDLMTNTVTVYMDSVPDDSLPLATQPSR